jgi:hypothetical protein
MRTRYIAFEVDRRVEPLDMQAFKADLARAGHDLKR